MRGDRWKDQEPPAEAYGRVTNAERFAPLHEIALSLLNQLEFDFDVVREEGEGLDPELEPSGGMARPSVRLTLRGEGGAPITVAFTTFPGIRVRFGRWQEQAFPVCGCDACDETLEDEALRFQSTVEDVVAGRFREALYLRAGGSARLESEFWGPSGRTGSQSMLDRDRALLLLSGNREAYEWTPWPPRK